ncbi:WXG100-like domain-containing protein [Nocardia testacea]|uniref:Outer membrane channel protein CpnT-like N-terminal domain-containing protein n=1 Tax=Nocardia testacea TaxID=248551 RepID=A0ABW7W624_9NOCA
MAIEIPHEVAAFLNFIGVPYPDINEDQVRELAGHVRTFADEVAGTHDAATGAITDMGSVYQGQSYRALVASWASLSSSHMEKLDELCRAVAQALEIAAEVITAVKVAVLTELAVLAATYTAAMAATVVTSGASLAVSQSISLAARRLIKAMEEMLIGYIVAEVLGKAIEPLEDAVADMINGVVYNTAADLLGVDPGKDGVVYIDPDEVRRYAQVLDDHADDIMKHAEKFANGVAALDFTTPVGLPGVSTPAIQPGGPSTSPVADSPGRQPAPQEVATTPRNWIPGSTAGAATDQGTAAPADTRSPAAAAPQSATGSPPTGQAPAGQSGTPDASAGTGPAQAGAPGAAGPVAESPAVGAQSAESRGERPPVVGGQEPGSDRPSAAAVHDSVGAMPGEAGSPAERAASQGGSSDAAAPAQGTDATNVPPGRIGDPGAASTGSGGGPASPWNRQSATSGASPAGSGNTAPGGRGRRRAADGDKPGRTAGGRRRRAARQNPWSARPAAASSAPARTPWGKPSERTEPVVPAVAAEGDAPPPVVSADGDRKSGTEAKGGAQGKGGAAAESVDRVPRPEVAAPLVSAPVRADEGPPPRE